MLYNTVIHTQGVVLKKHFSINITLKLMKINDFVRLSLLHRCIQFYKATPKNVNSAINHDFKVKRIKSVLAQTYKYLERSVVSA